MWCSRPIAQPQSLQPGLNSPGMAWQSLQSSTDCTNMSLFSCQKGWTWCLVSQPARAICRPPTCPTNTTGSMDTQLSLGKPNTHVLSFRRGCVGKKGIKPSTWHWLSFFILCLQTGFNSLVQVKWCFSEMVPERAGWRFGYTDLVFCPKS